MERIGTYDVLAHLGRGGMGVVLRARCALSGRDVALKVLDPALLTADGVSRFEREVAALARLRHPGVVGVLGAGRSPHGPWVAMELVDGESLQARLDRDGPLSPREAAGVGRALCDALAHAHAMGVVHRDVKPGNVLLGGDGRVVLVDFGLARLSGRQARLTATGELLGTPCFMAPEQAHGEDEVGPAADVYAVGATLYAALTGRPPVQGDGLLQVLERVLHQTPATPSSLRAAVPAALSALVMRCLAKAPAQRPETVEALGQALQGALDGPATARAAAGPPARAARPRRAALLGLAAALAGAGVYTGARRAREAALARLAAAEVSATQLDVEALLMRGRAQMRAGDGAGVLETAVRALALAPEDPKAVSLRASAAFLLGRTAEARAGAQWLDSREGLDLRSLVDAAALAVNLGDDAMVLRLVARARGAGWRDPRLETTCTLALMRLGRVDEAVEAARAALRAFPEDGGLTWNLAVALAKRGAPEALELCARWAARLPADQQWQGLYAQQLERRGDLAGAVATWTRYLERVPDDPQALTARGRLHVLRGDHDRARADHERAAEVAPDEPKVWSALAELHKRGGDLARAEAALDRLLALCPAEADAWRRRGEVRHRRARDGLTDLLRAVELDPRSAQGWSDLAVARAELGDLTGGVEALERAVGLAPRNRHVVFNLAQVALQAGQLARSLEAAEQALELEPRSPQAHALLAQALLALGRQVEGDAAAARALHLEPDEGRRATFEAAFARARARSR